MYAEGLERHLKTPCQGLFDSLSVFQVTTDRFQGRPELRHDFDTELRLRHRAYTASCQIRVVLGDLQIAIGQ